MKKVILLTSFFFILSSGLAFASPSVETPLPQDENLRLQELRLELQINQLQLQISKLQYQLAQMLGELTETEELKFQLEQLQIELRIRNIEYEINQIRTKIVFIEIAHPTGGEVWEGGQTHVVKWYSAGINEVKLSVCAETPLLNEKYTCWDIPGRSRIDASLGYYQWKIDPNSPWIPGSVRLRVTDIDSGFYAESEYFQINEEYNERKNLLICQMEAIMAQLDSKDKACTQEVMEMDCRGLITYTATDGCQISFLKNKGWTPLVYPSDNRPYVERISSSSGSSDDWITVYGKNLIDTVPSAITIEFLQKGMVKGSIGHKSIVLGPDESSLKFQLSGILVGNMGSGKYQIRVLNDNGVSNSVDFEIVGDILIPSPVIFIESNPKADSNGNISLKKGDKIVITGLPANLSKNYSRAFFFDSIFDASCTNTEWVMTCTAGRSGVSNFYIEVYQDGKTYRSNKIKVAISPYVIKSFIGNQPNYYPESWININLKAQEWNNSIVSSGKGFNVQAYIYEEGKNDRYLDPNPTGSYNARYNSITESWEVKMISPNKAGSYYMEIVLYCSQENSYCSMEYNEVLMGNYYEDKIFIKFNVVNELKEIGLNQLRINDINNQLASIAQGLYAFLEKKLGER